MKNYFKWNFIINVLLVVFEVLLLMYPAILNGYPFLYSDSASYIVSGHDGSVPIDRPIFYGLFVRHISMSFSLWFVVIAQALIVATMINYTFDLFLKPGSGTRYSFLTILILTAFTGLPNYISQIMPDLFTGVMIWMTVLLLFSESKKSTYVLGTGVVFAAVVHNSNMMTIALLLVATLFIYLIFRIHQIRKRLLFFCIISHLYLVVGSNSQLYV